jgi:hypothetical protein
MEAWTAYALPHSKMFFAMLREFGENIGRGSIQTNAVPIWPDSGLLSWFASW